MTLKSEAIKNFLEDYGNPDLAARYNSGMECQVMVSKGSGERYESETNGHKWSGWTDGSTIWKNFRIPRNANTKPVGNDGPLNFDLSLHVEGIGMTGWNWREQRSVYVAFDFDAIVEGKRSDNRLTPREMNEVRDKAASIPWVTVRRSTSGTGLHLYVDIEDSPEIVNHNEHAALGKAILDKMSALTGFNFGNAVDVAGSNIWVWHTKSRNTNGFELVKQGVPLTQVPDNWRAYLKKKVQRLRLDGRDPDSLAAQRTDKVLEYDHLQLLHFLERFGAVWQYRADENMLVTHTYALKEAHKTLELTGIFDTLSEGSDLDKQNCFCFPLPRGGWVVRRYGKGTDEHESWELDQHGYRRCFLNTPPTLRRACMAHGATEDMKGAFLFPYAHQAAKALSHLGVSLTLEPHAKGRGCKLYRHKDGRLVIELERMVNDGTNDFKGFTSASPKKPWTAIFSSQVDNTTPSDDFPYDDKIRHLVNDQQALGWVVNSETGWKDHSKGNIKDILKSYGHSTQEADVIIGRILDSSWVAINKPFAGEYPGNRQWNLRATRLAYEPAEEVTGNHPTWDKILNHIGQNLTPYILENKWCEQAKIYSGRDYLMAWIAAMIRYPEEPTAYLFLHGSESCGKSTLHEALSKMIIGGYQRADLAVTNSSGFNGELEGAVLAVIEEIDLQGNSSAYDRIKDWVTSPTINIRHMYRAPYHAVNCLHFIQCANDLNYLPIFPGDTRVTAIHVPDLHILDATPKRELMPKLEAEIPDLLATLYACELPQTKDRLRVPVVTSGSKLVLQQSRVSPIQEFFDEYFVKSTGSFIPMSEAYQLYTTHVDPTCKKSVFKKKMLALCPAGALARAANQVCFGNIWWNDREEQSNRHAGELVPSEDGRSLREVKHA